MPKIVATTIVSLQRQRPKIALAKVNVPVKAAAPMRGRTQRDLVRQVLAITEVAIAIATRAPTGLNQLVGFVVPTASMIVRPAVLWANARMGIVPRPTVRPQVRASAALTIR